MENNYLVVTVDGSKHHTRDNIIAMLQHDEKYIQFKNTFKKIIIVPVKSIAYVKEVN